MLALAAFLVEELLQDAAVGVFVLALAVATCQAVTEAYDAHNGG